MCDRPASRLGPGTGPGHALLQLLLYLLASNTLSRGSGFPLWGLPEEFIYQSLSIRAFTVAGGWRKWKIKGEFHCDTGLHLGRSKSEPCVDNHCSMLLVLVRPDTLKENGRFSPAPQLCFNSVNSNLPFREDISTRNTGNNLLVNL